MISSFDIYSIGLLLLSLVIFINRYIKEEPPVLPYFVIACTCAFGSWLGEAVSAFAATALLASASFLFVGCVLYPHIRTMSASPEETADDTPSGEKSAHTA